MHSRFVELSVRASGYGCTRAVWRTALVFSACLNSEMVAHESFNSTVPRNYQDKCDMSHFPNPSKVRPSNTVQQGFTLWARRMDIRGWFTGRVEQTETKINTNCGYKHDKTTHVLKKLWLMTTFRLPQHTSSEVNISKHSRRVVNHQPLRIIPFQLDTILNGTILKF